MWEPGHTRQRRRKSAFKGKKKTREVVESKIYWNKLSKNILLTVSRQHTNPKLTERQK